MAGEPGDAACPGSVRRWVITPGACRLREEVLHPGSHEFPFIDPRSSTQPHRVGYVAIGGEGGFPWQDGIARIDLVTGERDEFRFGPKSYVSEPVFAAKPSGAVDEGWLLVDVHDGNSGRNRPAVFDVEHPADGPIAEALLDHHLWLSFRGWWLAG